MQDNWEIYWMNSLSIYWDAFLDFLRDCIQNNISFKKLQSDDDLEFYFFEKIFQVCQKTEENFQWLTRLTGEYREYHSHLYEVAKLYILYAWKYATISWLIIALRHDDIEDLHKDTKSMKKVNFLDILREDWYEVALWVNFLTKQKVPHIDEIRKKLKINDIKSVRLEQKFSRDEMYYKDFYDIKTLIEKLTQQSNKNLWEMLSSEQLTQLARDIAIVRIVDRIHNLRTMPEYRYDNEKRLRKLKNTDEFLLRLAQSLNIPELYWDLVWVLIKGYKTYYRLKNNANSQFLL